MAPSFMKTRTARFLQRMALFGALTFALTGCGIELADLIEVNEIKVDAPFASNASEGSSSTPEPTPVSAAYVGGITNQTLATSSLSLQSRSVWEQAETFEKTVVDKELSGAIDPQQIEPCEWQFGYRTWEFATHCGRLLNDDGFADLKLKPEDLNQLLRMRSFGTDVTFSNEFTVTFTPEFASYSRKEGGNDPPDLPLLLFGVSGFVNDSASVRPRSIVMYAAGQSATLKRKGGVKWADSGNSVTYILDDPEYYLRAAATQDSAADVFGVLTNGVDNNLVRLTSILKFGMSDDVGPGDIQSVDYTVTLGDVTLSTQ